MLEGMSVVQLVAVRSWILLAAMTVWIWRRAGITALATRRPLHHALRAGVGLLAPLSFFVALKTIPLAEATAVFFCSVFLFTWARSCSSANASASIDGGGDRGFAGVLVVTRPGADSFQPRVLLVLLASTLYCAMFLMGRWMSSTESTFSTVFSYNLGSAVGYTLMLPWFWGAITSQQFAVLLLVSVLALAGHFLLTQAFAVGPVSVVAPYEYSALAWATLFGYLLWREVPAVTTVAGITMIVASGLYIAWRERTAATAQGG
ncbi:MAG: DMT family transporter [Gammaproteobacteria bacterium]|nr:DMT family transporter [Gammaproteobacteria bacterium]